MKLILEAKSIPVGSTVTKKTGEKEYTIRDDIKIYGSTSPEQKETLRELKADAGTRFMVSNDGNINIIQGDLELIWHVEPNVLYDWLSDLKASVY